MKLAMITVMDKYGVGNHSLNLVNELVAMNKIEEIHVIDVGGGYECQKFLQKEGSLFYHRVYGRKGLLGKILELKTIIKKISEIQPDLVHIHLHSPYLGIIPLILNDKFPVICTIHALYEIDEKYLEYAGIARWLSRKFSILLERIILRHLRFVIVVSPQLGELIKRRTKAKTYCVPNGVNIREVDREEDARLISTESPSILFIGRLTKRKGLETLLKALAIVKERYPNIILYVVGDGPQETELRALAFKLKIEQNVKFLGYISEKEKNFLLRSTNIFVLPSLGFEPSPIALLEAMAYGKPIVASKIGGIPFYLEDEKSGLFFEPSNFQELAEKICILLENEDLREKIAKGAQERARTFSWTDIAKKTLEIYQEVLMNYGIRNC
jgi:glycosyltransferase involved in cell wall biosynthesis